MTERLARVSSRHPWLTITAWVVGLVLSFGVVATLLGDVLTSEGRVTSRTDSERASDLQAERFRPTVADFNHDVTEVVVVKSLDGTVDHARVARLADDLRAAGASFVATSADDERLVSKDGGAEALLVALGANAEDDVDGVVAAVGKVDADPGYRAAITGDFVNDADQETLSQDDLRKGELFFGAPAALVILLLVFGAVVAGFIPLVLAILSIVVALALT